MRVLVILLSMLFCGCSTASLCEFQTKYVDRLHNWVLADTEYLRYKDKEPAARAEIQRLRLMPSVDAMAVYLQQLGMQYKLKNVEFVSYAWITIAKRSGECDDYQELWKELLNGKGKTVRVCVFARPDKIHAALLFYPKETTLFYLLSNLQVWGRGVVGEEDRLVRSFYGESTEGWFKY